jgi:acetyltransferase-like isoleucine patch superfamily enzyme
MIDLVARLRDAWLLRWWHWMVPLRLRGLGVQIDGPPLAFGWPIVSRHAGSTLRLGRRVALVSEARFTALGTDGPVVLRTLRAGASIVIGDDVGMSGTVVCAALSVHIGRECLIGSRVLIVDNDFHPLRPEGRRASDDPSAIAAAPVRIGDRVFIGAGSIVLKGVSIGEGSVIGAGSVVTQDVPPMSLAAGNPARVVRRLDPADPVDPAAH